MAALIPGLISAIMGSGRNKNFDPKDPNSKPYEERKTGMGRFLQRWGSGVDGGELNNEYSAKRRENEAGREQARALQEDQQTFTTGRDKANNEYTTGRDAANNADDWKRTQSHLANQARLEEIRQGFQARMQAAGMAQDQQKQNQDEARRLFEQTGTWDPIKQQEVMEKIRTQRMDEPRSLSGGIVYDPSSNQYIYNEPAGYAIGPDGKSMVHNPGGLRSTSRNLQSGMPAMNPAGATPPSGGRQLQGNPEELRQMLLGPAAGSGGEVVGHGGMGPGPASGESSGIGGKSSFSIPSFDEVQDMVADQIEGLGIGANETTRQLGETALKVGGQGLNTGKELGREMLKRVGINIPTTRGHDIVSQFLEKQRQRRNAMIGARGASGEY